MTAELSLLTRRAGVPVHAARALRFMVIVTVVVVISGAAVDLAAYETGVPEDSYWRMLFSLDAEASLPTWWAVILLAIFGWLAYTAVDVVASVHIARHRRLWRLLGGIAVTMSIDELVVTHEAVGRKLESIHETTGALSYAWVVPASVAVAVVAALYLRFVLDLPARVRRLTVLAGVVYVGGALGLEMLDGAVNGRAAAYSSLSKIIISSIQEAMEHGGVVLAVAALIAIRNEDDQPHLPLSTMEAECHETADHPSADSLAGQTEDLGGLVARGDRSAGRLT